MGYKSAEFPIRFIHRIQRLRKRLRDEEHWEGYQHFLVLTQEEMDELSKSSRSYVTPVAVALFCGFTVIVEEP